MACPAIRIIQKVAVMLMQPTGFVLFSSGTLPWILLLLASLDAILFTVGLRSLRRRGLLN